MLESEASHSTRAGLDIEVRPLGRYGAHVTRDFRVVDELPTMLKPISAAPLPVPTCVCTMGALRLWSHCEAARSNSPRLGEMTALRLRRFR